MSKRTLALFLLVLLLPATGLGEIYTFPYDGVRFTTPEDAVLLTPGTLDAHEEWILSIGGDPAILAADFAANNILFEVFLPGGIQVSLSVLETEQSLAIQEMERMTPADMEAFLRPYENPPYEGAAWAKEAPGFLAYHYRLSAQGADVPFARLSTITKGAMYTLTATGVGANIEALHEANLAILKNLTFLQSRTQREEGVSAPTPPQSIQDDGMNTPLSLVGFTGVTETDQTKLIVSTLPGAMITLTTPGDSLRATANQEGLHTFTVSTRRETLYAYTISAVAEDRTKSTIAVDVERRIPAALKETNYRKTAVSLDRIDYPSLQSNPEKYIDRTFTFRGMAVDFTELGGFPCAIVYSSNPNRGQWINPLFVLLTTPTSIEKDEVLRFYGDVRGDTMLHALEGEWLDLPVIICRLVQK